MPHRKAMLSQLSKVSCLGDGCTSSQMSLLSLLPYELKLEVLRFVASTTTDSECPTPENIFNLRWNTLNSLSEFDCGYRLVFETNERKLKRLLLRSTLGEDFRLPLALAMMIRAVQNRDPARVLASEEALQVISGVVDKTDEEIFDLARENIKAISEIKLLKRRYEIEGTEEPYRRRSFYYWSILALSSNYLSGGHGEPIKSPQQDSPLRAALLSLIEATEEPPQKSADWTRDDIDSSKSVLTPWLERRTEFTKSYFRERLGWHIVDEWELYPQTLLPYWLEFSHNLEGPLMFYILTYGVDCPFKEQILDIIVKDCARSCERVIQFYNSRPYA